MNQSALARLGAEIDEACRLDSRISKKKLWKRVKEEYKKTPRNERHKFTIFEKRSVREADPDASSTLSLLS